MIQIKHKILISLLIFAGMFFTSVNPGVAKAETSGASSNVAVEFYGKPNNSNTGGSSDLNNNGSGRYGDSGYGNQTRLPQTGSKDSSLVTVLGISLLLLILGSIVVTKKESRGN